MDVSKNQWRSTGGKGMKQYNCNRLRFYYFIFSHEKKWYQKSCGLFFFALIWFVSHCKYVQWNYSGNRTHVKSVHFTNICHVQSNVEVTAKKLWINFTFIPLYLKQQLDVTLQCAYSGKWDTCKKCKNCIRYICCAVRLRENLIYRI